MPCCPAFTSVVQKRPGFSGIASVLRLYHLYCFSPIEFSKSRSQSTVAKILRELNDPVRISEPQENV